MAKVNNRTSVSELYHIQELISAEELGDQISSQILQCKQQLLGNMTGMVDSLYPENSSSSACRLMWSLSNQQEP